MSWMSTPHASIRKLLSCKVMRTAHDHFDGSHALCSVAMVVQGAPPVSQLRKVAHPTPMLSLGSVPNKDELLNWVNRLRRAGVDPEAISWVVEPKVDGLAVRALYR